MSKKVDKSNVTLAQRAALSQQDRDAEAAQEMQGTVAGDIWNEIKDKSIEMFALPDQQVNMHAHPIVVEPSKLYLITNSTAVLPSLEAAIGKKYTVELADKYVIVGRAVVPLTRR